mmetsp:Transcript_52819/g.146660  ORF Transcript_52819/g.146660 Transcript_52819/m.146660 type:complete len:198 (+) Transcript_52819:120-713(+)
MFSTMPQRYDSGTIIPMKAPTYGNFANPADEGVAIMAGGNMVDSARFEADAQAAALEKAFEEKRRKFEADLAAKETAQVQRIAQMEALEKSMPELHARRIAELKKAKEEEERKARELATKKKQEEIDRKARAAQAKANAEAAEKEALAMQAAEEQRRADAAASAKQIYLADLRAMIVRGLKEKHIDINSTVGDLLSM